jgi:hypothetical protein
MIEKKVKWGQPGVLSVMKAGAARKRLEVPATKLVRCAISRPVWV